MLEQINSRPDSHGTEVEYLAPDVGMMGSLDICIGVGIASTRSIRCSLNWSNLPPEITQTS